MIDRIGYWLIWNFPPIPFFEDLILFLIRGLGVSYLAAFVCAAVLCYIPLSILADLVHLYTDSRRIAAVSDRLDR